MILDVLSGMELTFPKSCVIAELLPSAVIFWTELSCSRKTFSSKATLLLERTSQHATQNVKTRNKTTQKMKKGATRTPQKKGGELRYSRRKGSSCFLIFWTELSCSRKTYSNKATLLLGWIHRFKKYTVAHYILLDRYEVSISQMTHKIYCLISRSITFVNFFLTFPKSKFYFVNGVLS
jgi:hypothetical protein